MEIAGVVLNLVTLGAVSVNLWVTVLNYRETKRTQSMIRGGKLPGD